MSEEDEVRLIAVALAVVFVLTASIFTALVLM